MDDISTADVRRSDVLIGKLSPEELRVGQDLIASALKARGVLSAEEVGEALGVDASLIVELWSDAQ